MTPLARATRNAHLQLHRAGPFHRIAHGGVTLDDVACVLALHERAWSAAAAMPHIKTVVGSITQNRRLSPHAFFRLEEFRRALSELGSDPSSGPSPSDPPPTCDAAAWSAAYVWLGAHKGGKILGKRLGAAGFDRAAGCLASDPNHAAYWARLMDAIHHQDAGAQADIAAAANTWFRAFDVAPSVRNEKAA